MKEMNEALLDAWLDLTATINNDKMVSDLQLNEALICRILYRNQGAKITATYLCQKTKMLKSQMNRTLTGMEEKGLIFRKPSNSDRRKVYIVLNEKEVTLYEQEHKKILAIIDRIVERIGFEKAKETLSLFELITGIAKEEFSL